jgi:hypothetical protein
MRSWFGAALIWLLAAALPVQAWASAFGSLCDRDRHRMAAGASSAAESHAHAHAHAQHSFEGTKPSELERSVGGAGTKQPFEQFSAAGGSSVGLEGHQGDSSAATCSACASCCTSTVLASVAVSVDQPRAGAFSLPSKAEVAVAFVTDGPERPPPALARLNAL